MQAMTDSSSPTTGGHCLQGKSYEWGPNLKTAKGYTHSMVIVDGLHLMSAKWCAYITIDATFND